MSNLPEFTKKVGLDRNIVKLPETEEDWKAWKDLWSFVKPWHHGFGYFALPISGHTHHNASSTILYVSRPEGSEPRALAGDRTVDVHTHDFDQYCVFIGYRAGGEGLKGKLILGEKEYELETNTALFIPKGTPHGVLSAPFKMVITFYPTPIYY